MTGQGKVVKHRPSVYDIVETKPVCCLLEAILFFFLVGEEHFRVEDGEALLGLPRLSLESFYVFLEPFFEVHSTVDGLKRLLLKRLALSHSSRCQFGKQLLSCLVFYLSHFPLLD